MACSTAMMVAFVVLICLPWTHGMAEEEKPQRLGFTMRREKPQNEREKLLRQSPLPPINYLGEDKDTYGLCEGDCDNHEMCAGDFRCFDRDDFESVPGCSGEGGDTDTRKGADICYDPNTPAPSAMPSAAPSGSEPTISPAPTPPPPTFSPSLAPSGSPTNEPSSSPSAFPSRTSLFVIVDATETGLGKCEGECSEDEDCRGDLLCQKRGSTEFVPGCDGEGESGVNYCYDKRDGIPPPSLPDGTFRLRLYWERGYFWQENFSEQKYCLRQGNPPQIRSCGSGSKFEFLYVPGIGDMIRLEDSSMCLELSGNTRLSFEDCDEQNINQRWLGNWAARRFDVRSARTGMCMSNHHHPKSGEDVYLNQCRLAHMTDTGWWNVYR